MQRYSLQTMGIAGGVFFGWSEYWCDFLSHCEAQLETGVFSFIFRFKMNLEVFVGHFIGNLGGFVVLCVGSCLRFNIHDEVTKREEK